MKLLRVRCFFVLLFVGICLSETNPAFGSGGGIFGRTRKTTTAGCGTTGCHGTSASNLTVTLSGPNTLQPGAIGRYTLTIPNTLGSSGGGTNIAVSNGTLAAVSSNLRRDNTSGELTHTSAQSLPVTFTFDYTAPNTVGTQTMYAVGKGGTFSNGWNWAADKTIQISTTNVEISSPGLPDYFELRQNYPNPFNPLTTIQYGLPQQAHVRLTVIDLTGKLVTTLVNEHLPAGRYDVRWDGTNQAGDKVASGIYFYRLEVTTQETERVILVKGMTLLH